MRLVYIVGTGSKWSNNELRYSLRSVEQHGVNVSGITIVGYKPNWLRGIDHMNVVDAYPRKCDNAWHKILGYCGKNSEPFVLMNDDFFLLKQTDFAAIPNHYHGTIGSLMASHRGSSPYRQTLQRSEEWLILSGHFDRNYAIHCPMQVDPAKALALGEEVGKQAGVSFRCLYGNVHATDPQPLSDLKLYEPEYSPHDIRAKLEGAQWFSIGDKFLNETGKQFFNTIYSRASKYETA